jgi:hypothetical protein
MKGVRRGDEGNDEGWMKGMRRGEEGSEERGGRE